MLHCTAGREPAAQTHIVPQQEVIRYLPEMMDSSGLVSRQKKPHLLSSRWDQLDASTQTTHPSSDLLVQLRSEPGPIMMDLKAAATWVTTEALL